MEQVDLFYRFGVALAIGFLVGLQREYAYGGPGKEIFAGERTLALMGLVGCTAAMAADVLASPWPFVVILTLMGVLVAIAYFVSAWRGSVGLTTEVAAVLTIIAGALCYWNYLGLAVALTVVTTVLLSIKMEMDTFVRRITREDVYATLKFAVITAIVLPVLPNQSFGPPPWDVLNPYKIWLMVVLISAISFLGYVLVKVVGSKQGIGLTGLLGGMVSSTAVTLSFSERSQKDTELAKPFALAITVAWTVMFSRVVIVVALLNTDLLKAFWMPMAASAAVGLVYCVYLYISQHGDDEEGGVDFSNPFELGPAIKFGLIYGVILLISKAAQMYLPAAGIYLASIVAGLTDVDAITLSMAELSRTGGMELPTAARAVVLAAMSNTVVKGGIVLSSGSPSLRKALFPGFILMLVVGIAVAFLLI
jgi:uncharacterized membrane protein (DUF4010 family)